MWSGPHPITPSSVACHDENTLARKPEDQIRAEVRVSRLPRDRECLERPLRRVDPVEKAQLVRLQRLHADRQPIDPCLPVSAQPVGVDAFRVRLQRDLRVGSQGVLAGDSVEDTCDATALQQRRRPAADEHGRHWPPGQRRRPARQLGQQRSLPSRDLRLQLGIRVEVAVRALHRAERHVQVEADRVVRRFDHLPSLSTQQPGSRFVCKRSYQGTRPHQLRCRPTNL